MNEPLEYIYKFGDGANHGATVSESSTEQKTCHNYNFHIAVASIGLVGSGTYTLQVSDDLIAWYDYAVEFTNVAIEDAIEDADALTWKYSRIKYDVGTASAGTVSFKLTLKRH